MAGPLWEALELTLSDHVVGICYFFITQQELASRITAALRYGKQGFQGGRQCLRYDTKGKGHGVPESGFFHTDQYVRNRMEQVDNFTLKGY